MIAVVAIGGNSLTQPGEAGTFVEQQRNAQTTCAGIADLMQLGYRVVLTHGNGPQVGQALLRSELAGERTPALRLDECDAQTQGHIGYLLQQTLDNELGLRKQPARVVSVVTQVLVDPADPAFSHASKPIGGFFALEEAQERMRTLGWTMVEDAGRGWRRVVASPRPQGIIEIEAIRACLAAGQVVIAAGGGGIPVVRKDGKLQGVEAVIDKDRASALLAHELDADVLIFSTGVDRVALRFGKPGETFLRQLAWEDARRNLLRGEFPAGSMGPKIEAALIYLSHRGGSSGRRAVVTSPAFIAEAAAGRAGTEILPPVALRFRRRSVA
jgi:carbamate kinase